MSLVFFVIDMTKYELEECEIRSYKKVENLVLIWLNIKNHNLGNSQKCEFPRKIAIKNCQFRQRIKLKNTNLKDHSKKYKFFQRFEVKSADVNKKKITAEKDI